MTEVFENPDHIPLWRLSARGGTQDWRAMFRIYQAAVDWPAAALWPELSSAFPDRRLLVWPVNEGGKPLCDMLNTKLTDLPFPRENTPRDCPESRD